MGPFWKRMSSGKYIDLGNLTIEDIELNDIETALNNIVRFTGHYKDILPLTVAEHSHLCLVLAQKLFPDDTDLILPVFIHDFSEAYVGDVATPIKRLLGQTYYDWVTPIEQLIEKKFLGRVLTEEEHTKVKICDLTALDIERRIMWSSQYGKNRWPTGHKDVGTLQDKYLLFEEARRLNINMTFKKVLEVYS